MNHFGYVKKLNASYTGMVYKFTKKDDAIHTMSVGDLLYQLGFTQGDIVGEIIEELFSLIKIVPLLDYRVGKFIAVLIFCKLSLICSLVS